MQPISVCCSATNPAITKSDQSQYPRLVILYDVVDGWLTADQAWLSPNVLGRHLDADEAVVLGAGLFAANLSTTFRLRKFGMRDGITYPITIEVLLTLQEQSDESHLQ